MVWVDSTVLVEVEVGGGGVVFRKRLRGTF